MATNDTKTVTKEQLAELIGHAPGGDKVDLMHLDLVGAAEAAEEILQVERARIGKWRRNGILLGNGERISFPAPISVATSAAKQLQCKKCGTVYGSDKKRCPSCRSVSSQDVPDLSKLAATPLWWADDIRDLAKTLAENKTRDRETE